MNEVVIVGQGPRAFAHAGADVWVINGPRFPPRWDRLYQLHGLDHIQHKHPGMWLELCQGTLASPAQRIVMTHVHPAILVSEAFPLAEVAAFMGGRYFTNSFPLAMAHAGLEGYERIILDGVMWAGGSAQWGAGEGWAVPCVEYTIGYLKARGIDVVVPPGCGLFAHRDFVYGFEGPGSV